MVLVFNRSGYGYNGFNNMVDDKTQKTLSDLVSREIAGVCKLYGIDYYLLDKKQIDLLVSVFQLGITFFEEVKNGSLQSVLSHEKKR